MLGFGCRVVPQAQKQLPAVPGQWRQDRTVLNHSSLNTLRFLPLFRRSVAGLRTIIKQVVFCGVLMPRNSVATLPRGHVRTCLRFTGHWQTLRGQLPVPQFIAWFRGRMRNRIWNPCNRTGNGSAGVARAVLNNRTGHIGQVRARSRNAVFQTPAFQRIGRHCPQVMAIGCFQNP